MSSTSLPWLMPLMLLLLLLQLLLMMLLLMAVGALMLVLLSSFRPACPRKPCTGRLRPW